MYLKSGFPLRASPALGLRAQTLKKSIPSACERSFSAGRDLACVRRWCRHAPPASCLSLVLGSSSAANTQCPAFGQESPPRRGTSHMLPPVKVTPVSGRSPPRNPAPSRKKKPAPQTIHPLRLRSPRQRRPPNRVEARATGLPQTVRACPAPANCRLPRPRSLRRAPR